ncbi:NADH:flavin oxidoreductase/NADH oxidase family protein [Kutzneria sp. CA-103260]|uniref:NADH:flavin oxidoreductase/NADH oxidase family protein n=1 Tax=Kutzneria sp. CA-103260 TaxID=2802641 RepID=UPI001BACE3D5|nr:NADH:flavin oxidoreductase/NADH oxidase family protein [Kutzneria sp. CA-103260]QUQ67962.1 NADPH dehydrogenase [Kutzneria sp. CA-103260]
MPVQDVNATRRLADAVTLPCGQLLPNRLVKSAMSEALGGRDHGPSEQLERLYRRWGAGGYGLVVTGNVMIDRRQLGEPGNVVIEDDRHLDGLRRWAGAYRGSPLWMQLNHPGRQANPLAGRSRPVAPSAIASGIPGMARPRALAESEILAIVDRFGTAAAVAEAAGFDGVQIHGAHGYLVTQFLSPRSNQRTDDWGGDPERRRRFVLEVLRAIRRRVSPGFAVGIKLNSADFQRGGFTEEESREVVRALVAEGIDLIEISGGSYEKPVMMGTVRESTAAREAYFLDYARTVMDLAGDVPIAVTGGFRTRQTMTAAVAARDCDLVGLGRPTVVNPDAAVELLDRGRERLEAPPIQFGARSIMRRFGELSALDGALNLNWHTDQMHRMGRGLEPDPARGWRRAALVMVARNGFGALRPRRGQ